MLYSKSSRANDEDKRTTSGTQNFSGRVSYRNSKVLTWIMQTSILSFKFYSLILCTIIIDLVIEFAVAIYWRCSKIVVQPLCDNPWSQTHHRLSYYSLILSHLKNSNFPSQWRQIQDVVIMLIQHSTWYHITEYSSFIVLALKGKIIYCVFQR